MLKIPYRVPPRCQQQHVTQTRKAEGRVLLQTEGNLWFCKKGCFYLNLKAICALVKWQRVFSAPLSVFAPGGTQTALGALIAACPGALCSLMPSAGRSELSHGTASRAQPGPPHPRGTAGLGTPRHHSPWPSTSWARSEDQGSSSAARGSGSTLLSRGEASEEGGMQNFLDGTCCNRALSQT